ncbi:SDR family NAD(P)-dependent oxidoreductase [Paenibacillus protaetiae]|uniref:SDR family NAD(P)-dependent oxidoreductase n=1 Tax=Paenibacillus protaetiae TaxID=2509456 RepID=UPI001FC9860C|nr:SDR family NAD(P)-dependent oxidoreductase [Paenibacillus protaetiae]
MNILITGAGRGLGLHLAAEALRRGHSVIAAVRNAAADGALAKLEQQYKGRVAYAAFDVTDEQAIAQFAADASEAGITVDAVINNAAILTERSASIETLNMDEVARSFEINVFGPMKVVKHVLPLMNGTSGAIVNISSEAGSLHNAYGGDYPYAMTKTALNMFTEQLRHAVKERGIAVYSVHPGWIRTDMGASKHPGTRKTARQAFSILQRGK